MAHEDLHERLAALEAEVRELRAQVAEKEVAAEAPELSRRRLLRGGGLALAGAAGALASPMLTGKAAAANGDPVTVGNAFTGTATTSLTSTVNDGPTLSLSNPGSGAPLRIGNGVATGLDAGDIFVDDFIYFWNCFGVIPDGPTLTGQFHDSSFANFLVNFAPFRIFDTRQAGATATNLGRTLASPFGAFDAQGRLKAGATCVIDLSGFIEFADAMIGNFTVTGPTGGGWITAYPTGTTLPTASTVNYSTGQTIANFATITVGQGTSGDAISIYTSRTTHVLLDASGWIVRDDYSYGPPPGTDGLSANARTHARPHGLTPRSRAR